MSFFTTKIETYETLGNSHAVCRHDTWVFKKDQTFDTLEEAKDYVIQHNRSTSDFITSSRSLSSQQKDVYAIEFSLGDKHLHQCRWFVGKPPKKKIAALLQNDGIDVEGRY